jgi:hypothetical protein
MGILEGGEPDPCKLAFHWNKAGDKPASQLVPTTPKALSEKGTYYWLQDGTSIGGRFYCLPMIIGPFPEGPEGFEFKVHGVTLVSAPIGQDGPDFKEQTQVDTPLYFISSSGKVTYFGAAIMPNTNEAGSPNPDGYVYIYGLQNHDVVKLVAARVEAEQFEDFEAWTYWDGTSWSQEKERVVPIAEETSCEVSISPMTGGSLEGKYIVAFQQGRISNYVSIYIGDSPVGPFTTSIPIHYCREPDEGNNIYAYNAKGHPHLSKPGELLISYNVNTTSWAAHEKHASIYRPRFIRLRQLV